MRKFFILTCVFIAAILSTTVTLANDFKIRVYASNRTMDTPVMFGLFGRVNTLVPPQSSRQAYNDASFSGYILLIDMRFKDLEQASGIGRDWIEQEKCEYLEVVRITGIEPRLFEIYCKQPNGALVQVPAEVTMKKIIPN